jgi:ribosomal protein S19
MVKNYKKCKINNFLFKKLLKLVSSNMLLGKNQIFFKKNCYITKKICNNNVYVYKGNKFRLIKLNFFYVGYYFGNFTFTRKPFKYILKQKTSNKLIKR